MNRFTLMMMSLMFAACGGTAADPKPEIRVDGADSSGMYFSMSNAEALVSDGAHEVTVSVEVDGVRIARSKLMRFTSSKGQLATAIALDDEDPCGTPVPRPPSVDGRGGR